MAENPRYRPGQIAQRLGVSPATLRRWSAQFAAYLSPDAGEAGQFDRGGYGHRRYSEDDAAILTLIKDLLTAGQSYAQVQEALEQRRQKAAETSIPPANALATLPTPAARFLSETVQAVADGQQLLLNSQQANRDLLNLVIQDNFNLKEENAQLRERMMRLEQELSENRRREEARRELLERRLDRLEEQTQRQAQGPVTRPAPQRRRGWLARLLGL